MVPVDTKGRILQVNRAASTENSGSRALQRIALYEPQMGSFDYRVFGKVPFLPGFSTVVLPVPKGRVVVVVPSDRRVVV